MKLALFLLPACAAVVVLASPHNIHVARRHAIAARAPIPIPNDNLPLKRRQSKKRCQTRPPSSVGPSSTPGNVLPAYHPPTSTSSTPTSTPKEDAPTPTSVPPVNNPAPTPTSTTTTQSNSGNQPSFMNGVKTGQGTFYAAGLGACGVTNTDTDHIVAVSWRLFDSYPGYNGVNPNKNPICNQKIRATYEGKSTTVTVVDRCAADTCQINDLDFSMAAFKQLADFDLGRLNNVKWEWV